MSAAADRPGLAGANWLTPRFRRSQVAEALKVCAETVERLMREETAPALPATDLPERYSLSTAWIIGVALRLTRLGIGRRQAAQMACHAQRHYTTARRSAARQFLALDLERTSEAVCLAPSELALRFITMQRSTALIVIDASALEAALIIGLGRGRDASAPCFRKEGQR